MSEGILMTGFVAAVIACFVPLEALANLISLGTLMVFTFVDAGVILLRLGNVSEKILKDRLNSGNTRTEEEEAASSSTIKNHQKRVIQLLVVFTISVLGISFILSNTLGLPSSRIPLLFLTAVALICGMLICYTPDSWTEKHQSITVSPHFECPCFPIIPLGGVALNTMLMGGLPLSSWVLCAFWLACGLTIYIFYGINHSKLGESRSPLCHADTDRLLTNSKEYNSADQ